MLKSTPRVTVAQFQSARGLQRKCRAWVAMIATPMRRRLGTGTTPTPQARSAIRVNDDQAEIHKRRRNEQFSVRRKTMRLFSPHKSAQPEDTVITPNIVEIITRVIKMSTENKITAQNSWQVPMPLAVEHDFEEDRGVGTNFNRAGCALDAGAKIYSYRVEDTHRRTHRVLDALTRTHEETEQDGSEGSGARVASRRAGVASTLESNMRAITQQDLGRGVDADPVYRQLARRFDEGGARGMMLSHLTLTRGLRLELDARQVPAVEESMPLRGSPLRTRRGVEAALAYATTPNGSHRESLPTMGGRSPFAAFEPFNAAADVVAEARQTAAAAAAVASGGAGAGAGADTAGDAAASDRDAVSAGGDTLDTAILHGALSDLAHSVDKLSLCPQLPEMYGVSGDSEMDAATAVVIAEGLGYDVLASMGSRDVEANLLQVAATGAAAQRHDAGYDSDGSDFSDAGGGGGLGGGMDMEAGGFGGDVVPDDIDLQAVRAGNDGGAGMGGSGEGGAPPALSASMFADMEWVGADGDGDTNPRNRHIAALEAMVTNGPMSDYTFFDPRGAAQAWAGPEHWKFARRGMMGLGGHRADAAAHSDSEGDDEEADSDDEQRVARRAGAPAQRRVRKTPFYVNFARAAPDPRTAFAAPPRSRTATQISPGVLARRQPRVLPLDLHYELVDLVRLFLRPKALVRRLSAAPATPKTVAAALATARALGSFVDGSTGGGPSQLDVLLSRSAGVPLGSVGAPAPGVGAASGVGGRDGVLPVHGGGEYPADGFGGAEFAAGVGVHGGVDDKNFGGGMGGGGGGADSDSDEEGFDRGSGSNGGDAAGDNYRVLASQAAAAAGLDPTAIKFNLKAKRVDVRGLRRSLLRELRRRVGALPLASEVRESRKSLELAAWAGDEEGAEMQGKVADEDDDAAEEEAACGSDGENALPFAASGKAVARLQDIVQVVAPGMSADVTVPFYFLTLLHLANERSLRLGGTDTLDDVTIARD